MSLKTAIHEKVERARQGENPNVVARVPSGWVVLGDSQFLNGYCLLLPDPVVPTLNDMTIDDRARFLLDMSLIGDALKIVTGALRMNYEMLGNVDPALHAHVFPRFADEPEDKRKLPVWFYDWKAAPQFVPDLHRDLRTRIGSELAKIYRDLGLSCELAP